MKYKVGDRVRIVKKWNKDTCQSTFGGMDKWLGKVMTIKTATKSIDGCYQMEEDPTWYWNNACIDGLVKDTLKIVITTDGTETLARLYDGKKVIKSASAKCSPSDKFDFNTGVKIAVDRLIGEEKKTEKPHKKSKFEVGKYYKADGQLKGIIKITKIDEGSEEWSGVLLDRMHYEVIEGMKKDKGDKSFIDESGFAMSLTPIDYPEKKKYNGKVVCTKSEFSFWTVGKVYQFKDGIIIDNDGDIRGANPSYESFDDFKKRYVDTYPTAGKLDFIPLVD